MTQTHSSTRRTVTLALALLAALSAPMVLADAPRQDSRLSIQAQSSIEVTPDKASLSARLWERTPAIAAGDDQHSDPDALREARERLETRTGELIRTLEAAGLDRDAINAGSLNVRPEHLRPRQGDNDGETMVRTQLERPITLNLDDLEQLPTILDALTEAGVNALDGVQYDLHDRDAATDQALTQALEKARHKAQLIADTMEVELGRVVSIGETQPPIFMPRMMAMSADAMVESQRGGAEYRPGTITIEAGINVSWELEP